MANSLREDSFGKWLKNASVRNKFSIIIGLIVFILLFETANFWLAVKISSGLRAYVGGESLWSKAQKAADNSLLKYTVSFDEQDYNNFLNLLQVPLGDKQARLELEKTKPDLQVARQGFLQGGNNMGDIDDMIFLFRDFRNISYMDKAIKIWTEGDQQIQQLIDTGSQIHAYVLKSIGNNQSEAVMARSKQLAVFTKQVSAIDQQLTVLENNFSSTLGEGSRSIRDILLWLTVLLNILLGAIVIFVSMSIRRIIVRVDLAKSEFVSLASHQLRTPLTVIKWHSSRLLETWDNKGLSTDTQKKYTEQIYKTNQHMLDLVSAILNVSKIDLGTLAVEPENVHIEDIAKDVLKELEVQIKEKSLKISADFKNPVPAIRADPKLMRILFQNLLTNAIKYTPKKGSVACNIELRDNDLLITISDTGVGIPPKDGQRIFGKFYRTEAARNMDPNGNGLGMYIVKAIVDVAGGKIWFSSKENEGTTFYVIIPLTGMKPKAGARGLAESYS